MDFTLESCLRIWYERVLYVIDVVRVLWQSLISSFHSSVANPNFCINSSPDVKNVYKNHDSKWRTKDPDSALLKFYPEGSSL